MKAHAIAPTPIAAQVHTATIGQLVADWRVAVIQAEAEDARLEAANAEARKLYSPAPPAGLYGPFAWARDQKAADFWWSQAAAIDSAFGIPGLEEAANRAWKVASDLAAQVLALRPATVTEAALKYEIILDRTSDGRGGIDDPAPLFAFRADLAHLEEILAAR